MVQFDQAPGDDWGPSHLVVVDLRSGTRQDVSRTDDGASAYYNPRWSPDGRTIAVELQTYPDATESTTSSSSIAIVSTATGRTHLITKPSMFAGHPDFRRQDGLIVFDTYDLSAFGATAEDSNLSTVRPDGTRLRQLTRTRNAAGVRIGEPTWAPDGRSITATIGVVGQDGDDRPLIDAHLGTVSYPGGTITDSGVSGANPRLRPGR